MDKIEQANMRAILINWWEWNGYELGDPIFQTGMSEKRGLLKKSKDIFLNTVYIKAFDLSEKSVLRVLLKVARKKKILFFGYASSLFEISKIAQKNNIKLDVRLAMSQGDKLFNHYTTKIHECFGCNVVEDYGLNEGFMVGQKVDIPYFYIYTPSVFVEILDENDQPVPDGELGRIILTKLDGFAMPLIRFDSGDIGSLLPLDKYPENRRFNFPLLKDLIGRNTDIIETKNGNRLTVHSFTGVFEFYEEIEQFQVILEKADCLTLKYIPSTFFKEDVLPMIEEKLRLLMGNDLQFSWVEVLSIPTSKSGKPQILINNLIQNSLSDQR
jgi:phenylacetate-CoA ligase